MAYDDAGEAKKKRGLGLWQPILFLALLGVSIFFGLRWHSHAHAFGVPEVGYGMSLYLYETDASVAVNVSTTVRSRQFDILTPYFYDDVVVTVSATTSTHLLLATEEPYRYSGYQTQPIPLQDMGGNVYYLEFDVGGNSGSQVLDFHPPTTVSLSNSGHSNASLPSINLFADPSFVKASYVVDAAGKLYEASQVKAGGDPTLPNSYVLPSGKPPSAVFFAPRQLSTKELLIDGGLAFENTDVDVLANVPSSGSVQGSNYIWQSADGGMGPILRTVPRTFEADQARDEFLSGIALATAAAALIALIQAGPRRLWPVVAAGYRWVRRKPQAVASTGSPTTPFPEVSTPSLSTPPVSSVSTERKAGIAVAVLVAAGLLWWQSKVRHRD